MAAIALGMTASALLAMAGWSGSPGGSVSPGSVSPGSAHPGITVRAHQTTPLVSRKQP